MRSAPYAIAASLALIAALVHAQAPAPPGPADAKPPGVAIPLVNPGFESSEPGIQGNPQGWFSYQHAGPTSYVFALDDAVARSGRWSFRATNVGPEPFGAISQKLPAQQLRGKTLRYTAWLRTRDAKGNRFGRGGQMRMVALRDGSPVAHNFGTETPASGTTEWTRYEITLVIPQTADLVEIGALLFGEGILWIDDVALEVVAEPK